MALRLIVDYCGIPAEYWKITNTRTDYRTQTEIIDLALYASQKARAENVRNVLLIKKFVFPTLDMEREDAYNKIKEPILNEKKENINNFSNAENC